MSAHVLWLQIFFCLCGVLVNAQYDLPEVLVEALSPRGLRVSIPDEEGISLFAFHGKINKEMVGREAGDYSIDIRKAINGRWTFVTKGPKLKPGDVVNYWVNIDFDDGFGVRGYIKDDQNFLVEELIPDETAATTTTTTRSTNIGVCRRTVTMVNGQTSCKGRLIFEENFEHLSNQKWRNEIKFAEDPDYEFVIYQKNPENIYLKQSMLHIKPTLTDEKYGSGYVTNSGGLNLGPECTGVPETSQCYQKPRAWQVLPPVISAQISTKDHFSFTYGSVEIRAKFPKGDWIYPELRLRSRNDDYGHGYDSGEIKIAFAPGNIELSKTLVGGCILGQSLAARNFGIRTIRSENNWYNEFHLFQVDWTPEKITMSVDGKIYGNIYPPEKGFASMVNELDVSAKTAQRWKSGTKMAPFDKQMYISVGVGVGGQIFPNKNVENKPWDNDDPKAQLRFYRNQTSWSGTWNQDSELVVDYIKIWAL